MSQAHPKTPPRYSESALLESRAITGLSIGKYLIKRLQDYGVRHVFGIPGDYVLTFYKMLDDSPIEVVGCTREDCAGFAADAYARVNGMGAVCVTYCVGGLSLCNSIAGAYAEKSPVIVISGAPGLGERINNPLLHHKVRDFHTQADVFEKICVAGAELDDPVEAFREIDRVLDAAARFKRPGYLELPRDMVERDADQAAPVPPGGSQKRSGSAGRSRRRSDALDFRLQKGGDHRRRGNSPLRPAKRRAGPGRGLQHSPSPPRCWAKAW